MNNLKNEFVDKDVIVIDNTVYDVTKFLHEHPGGKEVIEEHLFRDASSAFNDIGHSDNAKTLLQKYFVGYVSSNNEGSNQDSSYYSSNQDSSYYSSNQDRSYYSYVKENPLFNRLPNNINSTTDMDVDVDIDENTGYNRKHESCSGLGRDCEQIRKTVVLLLTGFLGLVSAIVLYFITQNGNVALFIGMLFFFSYYENLDSIDKLNTDDELIREVFFY